MSTVEIILLGLVLNFAVFVFQMLIILIVVAYNALVKNVEFMQQFMQLEDLMLNLRNVRQKLRDKGLRPTVQLDYVFWVPYSGIWVFINFVYLTTMYGVIGYLYKDLGTKYTHLERKLNINS